MTAPELPPPIHLPIYRNGESPDSEVERHEAQLHWALGHPFTDGNEIEVLRNGDRIFPAMLEAIDKAETSVDFVTFVYWTGEVADAFAETLARAARRGVKVRVVIDAFGGYPMKDDLHTVMKEAGVELKWFRPLRSFRVWRNTHRTHRKILVVDREIGFTGGVGIAEEWMGDARNPNEWRETHFRIQGPAVMGLWSAFAGNWMEAAGSLPDPLEAPKIPEKAGKARMMTVRATSSLGWSDIGTMFDAALSCPERRVWLTTAYFVPDVPARERLIELADRGVDVRIMLPSAERSDKRIVDFANQSIIRRLLKHGVRIYRYQPAMLHAKLVLVDDMMSIIGSANLNHRSASKDDELSMIVLDAELNATLTADYERDLEQCEEVRLEHLKHRPWWHRLLSKLSFRLRAEM